MRYINNPPSFSIYKRFKILWIFFTIILFGTFSYINYQNTIKNSIDHVNSIAVKLANQVDVFVNAMFHETYSIPAYKKRHVSCSVDFDPYLQHVFINNSNIAALAIRDPQNNIICSTLPDNQSFLLGNQSPQAITGPLSVPLFDNPIYIMQKKIGTYQIEIVIMSSSLLNELHISGNSMRSVTLTNTKDKIKVVDLEHTSETSWLREHVLTPLSLLLKNNIVGTAPLSSLEGNLVNVTVSKHALINKFFSSEILLLLETLVISILLYYLIKKQVNKHYSLFGLIRHAIKKKQFYPVYQPLFDTKTRAYTGVEVLLRWQGSHEETIMPDFFIEEAEDTGLIVPITLQIVELAFKETKHILKTQPTFHLSFNICALHFTDGDFFPCFYKLMDKYSISSKQILLEITERDLLDNNDETYINTMYELREAGYSLAIDDYGTGHSSISYLHHFPFNYLKIDKIFIQAIGTKAITESLNDAIIRLAKTINLTIIAEGVETIEQVNYLLKNEVRFLQGWYFSRALSIEELINLLQGEKK